MLIFKALHILAMVAMVVIFLGAELFYTYAYWRRDVRALAWLHIAAVRTRLPIVGLAFLVLGIAFGLLTAATGGLDLLKGWLLAAYALVAAFIVNSSVLGERLLRLARKSVVAEAGQRVVEDVVQDMESSRGAGLFLSDQHRDLRRDHPGHGLKPF